jgi:hypothetical protein
VNNGGVFSYRELEGNSVLHYLSNLAAQNKNPTNGLDLYYVENCKSGLFIVLLSCFMVQVLINYCNSFSINLQKL